MDQMSENSLVTQMIWGPEDIVDRTIKEIRTASRHSSLCLRFSGGKDSVVVKRLLDMAGVSYTARFSRTSVDPPELLQFIRSVHPDVRIEQPRISMFQMIIKKGFPPTRMCRYCCQEFKERNVCGRGSDILTVTGVRKAESPKRKSRSKYETCQADKGVNFFHPIIHWSDEQVWDFIDAEKIPYCSLYDEGITRIGCIGCPLASSDKMLAEFKRWPNFERAYLWAFDRMLEGRQFDKWKTKYDVMDWYLYGAAKDCQKVALEGQVSLFDSDYFDQFDVEGDLYHPSADEAKRLIENLGAQNTLCVS